ncbi:MAG: prepilin-type N-terminal cleavage/methylation domain-containing protein [bacterium]|nr:prepilin-type N-terminal cleavage/methylation domain-containing protein [bacterium]
MSGLKRGMTLVEAMVAIALVAVVTGSLVNIGLLAVANSTSANRRSLAIKYAEEGLEIVRSYRDNFGFDSLYVYGGNCYGTYSPPATFLTVIGCSDNGGKGAPLVGTPLSRKVTIEKDPNGGTIGLGKQVLVKSEIFWSEKGRETNVNLTTILSKW